MVRLMSEIFGCFPAACLPTSALTRLCNVNGHIMEASQAPEAPYSDASVKVIDVRLRNLRHNEIALYSPKNHNALLL